MKLVYVKLPKYVRKRCEMRIREKCYISLGDGKVTVLNEAGEETCLNDFTDKEAQAKDMLLEIKRLLCDFYYVPKFFVVNDFYVYWDSDFDKALMIGDDEPRGICFYDCENMTIYEFAQLSKEVLQQRDLLDTIANEEYIVCKKGGGYSDKEWNIEVNKVLSQKLYGFQKIFVSGEKIYMEDELYRVVTAQIVKQRFIQHTPVLMKISEGKWIFDGFINSQI